MLVITELVTTGPSVIVRIRDVPLYLLCNAGLSYAERMKQIVTFKQTGEYPVQGLSPKQKNHFRVSARRYTLSENGDLMCMVKGQFFPGEKCSYITGATGCLVRFSG